MRERLSLSEAINMKILFFLFLSLVFTCSANAQSTLALQERCTEGAKKYLESHPPIGIIGHVSHYNKRFNKCFMRVDCYYSETGWQLVQLVDAFESKLIGSCLQMKDGTLMGCYVETERCASRNEFEALIKLYMGE